MALGGGTFTVQNKVLPGSYINFVSAANASAELSERGTAAVGLELSALPADEITEITAADLQKNAKELLGYEYSDGKLVYLREILKNATKVLVFPLPEENKDGADSEAAAAAHSRFLDKLENYAFNALCCLSDDEAVKRLYAEYTKRLREENGKKFQSVIHGFAADSEGVINVKNAAKSGKKSGLAAWVCGVAAGTAVNRSALNKLYDGELEIDADFKQSELEKCVERGEFTLHRVGSELRVLMDINSLVTVTEDRGEIFKENQTVRVVDQIGNDIAALFASKYLGTVPNDAAGRISLWSDIVQHHRQLADIRAIEDFSEKDVEVLPGTTKKSVVVKDAVTVVNAMAKLYMTVTVA